MSYNNTKSLTATSNSPFVSISGGSSPGSEAFDNLVAATSAMFEEKPPAPPVRLASAAQQNMSSHYGNNNTNNNIPLDMRPLPKAPEEDKKFIKKGKLRSSIKLKSSSKQEDGSNGSTRGGHYQGSTSSSFGNYKNSDKPVISPPTNFEHTIHVGFDPNTGEFTGMPTNWSVMLKNSNISKLEQKKNPQAVIEVLKWYESNDKDKGFKFMTMRKYCLWVWERMTMIMSGAINIHTIFNTSSHSLYSA